MSLVHSQNPAKKQSHYVSTIASNYITIVIVITLFQSQIILANHKCSTNWGDCQIKYWRGKPEYPEKKHSEQSREPTQPTYDTKSRNLT